MNKKVIFGGFIPLFIGLLIYILFRPENIRLFGWFKIIGIAPIVSSIRDYFFGIQLPSWFIYNLPDGLWIFSLTYFLLIIMENKNDFYTKLLTTTPLLLALILEFSQLFPNNKGTFDFIDITFYIIGFFLPFIINNFYLLLKFKHYEQKN